MKVKKFIGQTINGFLILDTYQVITTNGKKSGKVLVRCERCGREFERTSSQNFNTLHCKCMNKVEERKTQPKMITYNGKEQKVIDFCDSFGIDKNLTYGRLKAGWTAEDLIRGSLIRKCEQCNSSFNTKFTSAKFCSRQCEKRHQKGLVGIFQPEMCVCPVCNAIFISSRCNSQCCSDECRKQLARIKRNGRYKHLQVEGKFDPSVILVNVFNKFNGKCVICDKQMKMEGDCRSNDYPSMDHIIPLSKGGTHEWKNIQLLCRKCNCEKHDKIDEIYGNVVSA